MAVEETAADAAASKPRSLFKRPAWAKPPPTSTADDSPAPELFTRRNLALEDLVREQEEERQRKAEKDKREAETNARNEKRKSAEVDGPEDLSKRRRISEETYARYGLPSPTKKAEAPKSPAADTEQQVRSAAGVEERTATSSKVTSQNKTRSGKARESNQVISLDSDDDDDEPTIVGTKRSSPPPEDSDEEFPELVALARERRRKREAEAKASKSATVPLKAVATVSPPENDPVLKLLITSPLPSTKPLLVHRRLSQRLMEIRLAWCQRQGFSDSDTQNVFLTYKMRRVYDVTTCKSLGIKVDAAGNVIGDRPSNVFQTEDDGDAGRIHLIAVTEAVFEELKRQKEAEKAAKVVMPTIEPDEAPASSTQSKSEDQKIRILIKAKGFNDYKLIVRPTTTCDRIIAAFRRENNIPTEKHLVLVFDGEDLQPEAEVSSTDIEDMDNLEIHVR